MADTVKKTEEQKVEQQKEVPMGEVKKEAETAKAATYASDPEEDDLSDLDDVLDEFANTKLDDSKAKAPAQPAAGADRPDPASLLEAGDDDEFAKQLQAEMEQLLGQKDFQKQFDEIMKEVGALDPDMLAAAEKGEGAAPKSSAEAEKAEKSFQESIRRTMARMQESGEAASAASAQASDENDILAQMLKEMESGGFGGEGNEEDFSKILMGMMEQLTNKEILYEPMKELNDKFPGWMDKNKDKVAKDDLKRYEEQQLLVSEITARFERKGYSDSNASDREFIVERMQKVCYPIYPNSRTRLTMYRCKPRDHLRPTWWGT